MLVNGTVNGVARRDAADIEPLLQAVQGSPEKRLHVLQRLLGEPACRQLGPGSEAREKQGRIADIRTHINDVRLIDSHCEDYIRQIAAEIRQLGQNLRQMMGRIAT